MDGIASARCSATNRDGGPCNAAPGPDGLCRWHSPAMAERVAEGRRRGGRNRSNANRAKKALPAGVLSIDELRGVLGITIARVLKGDLEPAIGNSVAALARAYGGLTEAAKAEELVARLDALEAAAKRAGAA